MIKIPEEKMKYKQIGIIHSPFKDLKNMPIQPKGASEIISKITVYDEYKQGLSDLELFSHIYLIYHFHKSKVHKLKVIPFLDNSERGVFATRSPQRPNHIGLSVVQLLSIEENEITIKGVDVLDGTPLLDIKPYIAKFDSPENSNSGWMNANENEIKTRKSDDRFID